MAPVRANNHFLFMFKVHFRRQNSCLVLLTGPNVAGYIIALKGEYNNIILLNSYNIKLPLRSSKISAVFSAEELLFIIDGN